MADSESTPSALVHSEHTYDDQHVQFKDSAKETESHNNGEEKPLTMLTSTPRDSTTTTTSTDASASHSDTSTNHSLSDHEGIKSRTLDRVTRALHVSLPRRRHTRRGSQSSASSVDSLPAASEAAEPSTSGGIKTTLIKKLSVTTRPITPPPPPLSDSPLAPITSFSPKRNRELHRLFPTLPETETHIDDFICALQKEILIQGRIYLTERHLCFAANIFGYVTNLVIEVEDIVGIEKRSVVIFPNAVLITLKDGKQYFFASFVKRDEAYLKMLTLLHAAKHRDDIGGPSSSSSSSSSLSPASSSASSSQPSESLHPPTTGSLPIIHPNTLHIPLTIPILLLLLLITLCSTFVLWRLKRIVTALEVLSSTL